MDESDGASIAKHIGISPIAFERLVRGEVPETVADIIGHTTSGALQRFVEGDTSSAIARRLKCNEETIQLLRDAIGREGAIGLLIGLCVPVPSTPR